jgi:hypothetical protein
VPFNVGPGELEAWATGYNPIRKPVSIEAGKVTEVRMDFVLAATTGVVRLRSAPEGVNISLQGVDLGAAPLEWEGKPGNYTFEGRRAGYEPGKLTVVVRRGERSDALLTLRREEPITRRWWFWASVGAGVVTVGTVLGVLAYNTERKPDSGTLVPGNVASPLLVF